MNGPAEEPWQYDFETSTRALIERDIKNNRGVYSDVFQEWMTPFYCSGENSDELRPIASYEARIMKNPTSAPHFDLIMQLSDPERVAQFNALVATFNSELPTIKAEKNFLRANDLAREAWRMIRKL